ncbi:lipoate--protein ligase family protein, partial [Candidatus Bathyarchaeota archaeon]
MTVWRLLKLETHDAFMNMAIDEAVLTARIKNLVPNTLRFYRWKPSAVSIGRFQNIQNEVLLDNCK